jgi:PIN domain nuclease of toxin-antitoxin system
LGFALILLDTHIWHWWANGIEGKLKKSLLDLIGFEDKVAVSVLSCHEGTSSKTHELR